MSFSLETKSELCHIKIKNRSCILAALAAWIRVCGSLQIITHGKKRIKIKTESYFIARWGIALAKRLFDIEAEIFIKERKRLGKNKSFSILFGGNDILKLIYAIGLLKRENNGLMINYGIPEELVKNECCKRAFLRGLFIGAGSMSSPDKGYHLEIVLNNKILFDDAKKIIEELSVNIKSTTRKSRYILYLKESEKITTLLTLMGAQSAILEFESIKVYKDFRNNLNRQVNCETGNIQKTVTAASRQIQNIKKIINAGMFDSLSNDLRITAEARVNNPDSTLAELANMISLDISKSGINHRLRKLEDIADNIK